MKQMRERRPKRKKIQAPSVQKQQEEAPVIEPDALLKEVEEANEHIANPEERERVIPSRPC